MTGPCILAHARLIAIAEECLLDFEAADTEGDGFIGFKEFIHWWTS
jgi:hypothetical protein